jgi:RimJ/RimL family protein N-acetyltransferase
MSAGCRRVWAGRSRISSSQGRTAVGTFRIDGDEISYTVAPDCRGMGACTAMLRQAHAMFGPLRAEIKPENIASIKAAERAGMIVHLLAVET